MTGPRLSAVLLALAVALPAAASWRGVVDADARLEQPAAVAAALAAVREAPAAEAAAAAAWWLDRADLLADPEALVEAARGRNEPEVRLLVARLSAGLDGGVPAGSLARATLSGPWGVFDTLDLERDVVPPDSALPASGTRLGADDAPFRLVMGATDGWLGPPGPMLDSGVYLLDWTLQATAPAEGWLVVEAEGSYVLELDGDHVDRHRARGGLSAGTSWYRLRLEPGLHRLRVAVAAPELPRARVSLLGNEGRPLPVETVEAPLPVAVAGSSAVAALPPAEAAVDAAARPLLAAALARVRRDPLREREVLEAALAVAPEDEHLRLAFGRLLLEAPTGGDPAHDAGRARAELERARALPEAKLLAHGVARAERREEDARRIADELLAEHPDDPRVLALWVRAALERGWAREAEDAVRRLEAAAPGALELTRLWVAVLERLEGWEQRRDLMRAAVARRPHDPSLFQDLLGAGLQEEALELLAWQRERAADPTLDLAAARLELELGRLEAARATLAGVRERWGELEAAHALELALAAWDGPAALDRAVVAARAHRPADLDLLALAWRAGRERFWAPFAITVDDLPEPSEAEGTADAVLLLDQAVERVFPDGSSLYYYHGVTLARTPAGARQAAEVPLLPGALLLAVRVIKPDGRVVVPPEVRAADRGIQLRGVAPGDLVEQEYVAPVAATRAVRRGHLSPYVYRFADSERAFGLSEYVILSPPELELAVDGYLEGLTRTERRQDGLDVLHLRASDMAPIPDEPFGPPEQELLPWVSYGFGVGWSDVGDVLRDRALAAFLAGPDLDDFAAPLLAGGEVEPFVEALLDEVDRGDAVLELGTTAGASFARRRGNRLGIVATALLRAGWTVDLVLSRPFPFAGSHLEVPTLDAFAAPVLRVARDGRVTWIDLEEERRGIGRLRPILQRSDALVLPLSDPRAPVERLAELPSFANPELEERVRLVGRVAADGSAALALEMGLGGGQGERILELVEGVPAERADQVYQRLAATLFPGAEEVRGAVRRLDGVVQLELELDLPGACTVTGGAMECRALGLARPLSPGLASLPERRFPLILQLPIERRIELDLELPPGWRVERAPRRLETRWGEVAEELETPPGRLAFALTTEVPAQRVEPEEYPEWVRFTHAVDELTGRPIRLERTPGAG